MADTNHRYRRVINTPSFFPQFPNHHHHPQFYDVPTVFPQVPNPQFHDVATVFPQVPNHHHHHQQHPQVYNIPTVLANDPNHHQHHQPQLYRVPSSYTQNPSHHNQVYKISTVFAQPQQPPPQPPPVVINASSVNPLATTSAFHHNLHDITYHTHTIHTLLTSSPNDVDYWILDTLLENSDNRHNRHPYSNNLIVGLDVEWRPNFRKTSNNPVATIQLCVGNRCLVFQILRSPYVPQSLFQFLGCVWITFVGVDIESDIKKLLREYNLRVVNFVDLRGLAVGVLGDRQMRHAGLKSLSARVLGLEMEKPKNISMSNWDKVTLSERQVKYACIDAFVSFEVGRRLFDGSLVPAN